MSRSERSTRI